jgi:mRNA deadenylase 3'-5' endonuclease subunit Ccr4
MKKQKQKRASKKRSTGVKKKTEENKPNSWVEDRLEWIPVDLHHRADQSSDDDVEEDDNEHHDHPAPAIKTLRGHHKEHDFSVVSWNVLADSYCNRTSHRNLPMASQRIVFDRKKRQHLVRQTLRLLSTRLSPDLIALQEVDPPLEIAACMKELGYGGAVETTASPNGRIGRVDSCGLFFQSSKWRCLEHATVQLDDLATLQSGKSNTGGPKAVLRNDTGRSSVNSNLQGLQASFIRRNKALLVRLEHAVTGREIVVAVAHLFWNPAYEYVKVS